MFPLFVLPFLFLSINCQQGTDRWINEGNARKVEGKANAETLVFVQMLWRHGDRTPTLTIPTDKDNQEESWVEGMGELTREGMGQQMRLGKWLRKRYGLFVGKKWDRKAMYFRSSDYNRTLMSAQANVAGFFPPSEDEIFDPTLPWRPIPVHTVPREIDRQLYEEISCPVAEKEKLRIYAESPIVHDLEKKNEALLKYLGEKSGIGKMRLNDIYLVHDPLFVEKCHNSTHKWPSWMNESLFEEVVRVYDDASRFAFHTHMLRRLRGGPLVHEVLDRFADKSKGDMKDMKMYAYSAHDTTLAAILATFGIFPQRFPLYATAIMMEMHKRDGQYYIEMYHKNETDKDDVYEHEMEGCPKPCTLNNLKKAMAEYEPEDWQYECGLPGHDVTRYVVAIFILALTSIFFGTVIAVDVLLKWRKRRRNGDEEGLLNADNSDV